jgi:hypothetical protein
VTKSTQPKPEALLLIENAAAFAQSALRLCDAYIDDEYDRTPSYHNVLLYLLYLSIELCCKAWLSAQGRSYKQDHDLTTLHDRYHASSPPVELEMPKEFRSNAPHTLDLFKDHPARWHDVRHTHYKYAMDKTGNRYPEVKLIPLCERKPEIESVARAVTGVQLEIWRLCGLS